jgi:hypothetical protein
VALKGAFSRDWVERAAVQNRSPTISSLFAHSALAVSGLSA